MANAIPTSLEFLRRKPARMHLQSVARPEYEIEAQFNPTELKEKIGVNYNRLAVVGLSHKPLQYQNTDNHTFDIELAFRVYDDTGNRLVDNEFARRFLFSHCYPKRGAGTIVGGAPSRVLFVWPNFISMTCVITSVEVTHTFFSIDGTSYHFAARVALEAFNEVRISSDDLTYYGTFRPSTGGG